MNIRGDYFLQQFLLWLLFSVCCNGFIFPGESNTHTMRINELINWSKVFESKKDHRFKPCQMLLEERERERKTNHHIKICISGQ